MNPRPMHRFPHEESIYLELETTTLAIEDRPTILSGDNIGPLTQHENPAETPTEPSEGVDPTDDQRTTDRNNVPIEHEATPIPERTPTPLTPVYIIPQN